MTKRELYKYLEGERQHRLNQLEQQENEEEKAIKAKFIKQHDLDSLAKSIAQYVEICIQAYDQALSEQEINKRYDNPYRKLLELQSVDKLAEDIRDDAGLGDTELKETGYKFKQMTNQVYESFRKLELLVQDSINAKTAIKSLQEIGFNINIQPENKEAFKQMFNSEVLFGKKEN